MDASALTKLLAAYAMVTGAHSGGHFYEAEQQGLPARLNLSTLTEDVGAPYRNNDREARFGGAGFRMQDSIMPYFDKTEMGKPMRVANAAYKTLYPMMVNKMATGAYDGGDLGQIDHVKGKNYGREALAISAAADLLKAGYPEELKNHNLSFWQDPKTGAPGLQYQLRW